MKPLLLIVGSILLLAVSVQADYIVKQQVENGGQTQNITLKLKGAKCRVDATEQTSAIMDANTGETTVLVHPQKSYMTIGKDQLVAQAKAMKDMLGKQNDNPADTELKPTGKKETINGYETEEYTYDLNGTHNTVAVAKSFPDYKNLIAALYNVQSGPGMEAFRTLALPPDKFPGMPIRTTVEVMNQKVTTTLSSVQQTPLTDAEFTVPADYKQLQINAPSPAAAPPAAPGK
ncbi:MAG TPA: DUF4412 domain-containing protein [Chthoniobacterales bacterium]